MNGTTSASTRTAWDALIVFLPLSAITFITVFAIGTYRDNVTGVTTILAAIVPAIAAIGAAAFGISYASQARAAQAAAERNAQETTEDAQTIETHFAPLKEQVENLFASVQDLPGRAGKSFSIMRETEDDIRELRQVSMQSLETAKAHIAQIEVVLQRINSRNRR